MRITHRDEQMRGVVLMSFVEFTRLASPLGGRPSRRTTGATGETPADVNQPRLAPEGGGSSRLRRDGPLLPLLLAVPPLGFLAFFGAC